MNPQFITFTGADDKTDMAGMIDLSQRYPIEWGILFSASRAGKPRYPTLTWVEGLRDRGLNLSAHICGSYAKSLIASGALSIVDRISGLFQRAQINTKDEVQDYNRLALWGQRNTMRPILQSRDPKQFPTETRVFWLYDMSGGEGLEPTSWPLGDFPHAMVGYAGGINPQNVTSVLSSITSVVPYWIDMESGVRTDDEFDLKLCQEVCEAVFGKK